MIFICVESRYYYFAYRNIVYLCLQSNFGPVDTRVFYSVDPATRATLDCHAKEIPMLTNREVCTIVGGRTSWSRASPCGGPFFVQLRCNHPFHAIEKAGGYGRARGWASAQPAALSREMQDSCDHHVKPASPWCSLGLSITGTPRVMNRL